MDGWTHCSAIAFVGSTSVGGGWYDVKRSVIEQNIFNQHTTAIEGYFADPLVKNNCFTRVAEPAGRAGYNYMIWIRGGTGFTPPTYQAKWDLECNLFKSELGGEAVIMTGGGCGESGLLINKFKTTGFDTGIRTFLDNQPSYVTVTNWNIDGATEFDFDPTTRNLYDTDNNGLWDDPVSVDPESDNPLAGCSIPGDEPEPIPEFSTIAIPVVSILGLLFLFNYRKRRRN